MLRLASCAVLLTAFGCVDESDEPNLGEIESLVIGCPKWGCNENSPVMGPYKFHELHLGGLVNKEGVSVDGFWKETAGAPPVRYTPFMNTNGAEIRAINPLDGALLTGNALEGGYLKLLGMGDEFRIYFTKVTPASESLVKFWVGPATPIETYELTYTGPNSTHGPLCFNPPAREDGGEGGTHVWEAPLEAILYTHERIDAQYKKVNAHGVNTVTNRWITVGCAGSALAKLHLTRHTWAGITSGYGATKDQMQAMLKMYVSDVCGTGQSFTDQGTPLHWQNAFTPPWAKLTGDEYAIEALWNQYGAICLDVHRLGWKYDNVNQIGAACANKPACPTLVPGQALPYGAYLVSAVPEDPFPFIQIQF